MSGTEIEREAHDVRHRVSKKHDPQVAPDKIFRNFFWKFGGGYKKLFSGNSEENWGLGRKEIQENWGKSLRKSRG